MSSSYSRSRAGISAFICCIHPLSLASPQIKARLRLLHSLRLFETMDNTFLRILETMDNTFTHKGRCSVCKDVQNFDVADGAAYLADTKVKIKCKKNVGLGDISVQRYVDVLIHS